MSESELYGCLQTLSQRQRRFRFWIALAACWAAGAGAGALLILGQKQSGWTSSLSMPAVALLSSLGAAMVLFRLRGAKENWHELARQIEMRHPALDGRLLTAVQQQPDASGRFGYLQERLMSEAFQHSRQNSWADALPSSRLRLAQAAHWSAALLLLIVLASLHTTGGHQLLSRAPAAGITVTPGDTSLERGSSLVVLARFIGPLPPNVTMVIGTAPEQGQNVPLLKSLSDPMFGGSVPEVQSNLVYRIEYGAQRTRDFKVTVFEHPALRRADADLVFPEYTAIQPQHIDNTRRISAVEGTKLDLALQLNKPVTSARLVAKDKEGTTVTLSVDTNRPAVALRQFALDHSATFDLQLVDADGRTNKEPAQFVFEALKNRPPEIKIASPRGDLRPSPIEEIPFAGTVWDDFGVRAFGLGYVLAGNDPTYIELGREVPAKEKRSFQHLLHLEDFGLRPDQLFSWFVWADDIGPDGQMRRTTGDLFFGEVRPFEEVFREGQGMEGQPPGGQQGGESGEQGDPTGKLADLQKQIILATWKLQRDHRGKVVPSSPPARKSGDQSSSSPNRYFETAQAPASSGVKFSGHENVAEPPVPAQWFGRPVFFGAVTRPVESGGTDRSSGAEEVAKPQSDPEVVRDSQAQALEQAKAVQGRQQDPRAAALWANAIKDMEQALARLEAVKNSPEALAEALAAEQAAYQALLRLQEHEYQVGRNRNRNQGSSGRNQQMQRQLEEMDLAQSDNRYENQRQAQSPQNAQRREQLQVMNRLQELARRQQDLNERLKELQTALQEARTDQEREEIRRRLKRLQEEEQQMLTDVDELRQRMDRPENQSQMAEERRQLDQTRDEVQKASEAASRGEASQALAAGTRAQRELQDLRDQMRKENSNQFANDMRQMRSDARELARQQDDLLKKMEAEANRDQRMLSESDKRKEITEQLARQRERLTNLVDRASQVSRQAEEPEPALSRQLYDSVRKFSQDSAKDVKELQDQLVKQRAMTRSVYDQLRDNSQPDGSKLMEVTSELVRQDMIAQASEAGQRSRAEIESLKRGVERAAENVVGDDTEALRQARRELDQLTEQLGREMAQAQSGQPQTNGPGAMAAQTQRGQSQTNGPGAMNAQAQRDQSRTNGPGAMNAQAQRDQSRTNGPGAMNAQAQRDQPQTNGPGAMTAQAQREGTGSTNQTGRDSQPAQANPADQGSSQASAQNRQTQAQQPSAKGSDGQEPAPSPSANQQAAANGNGQQPGAPNSSQNPQHNGQPGANAQDPANRQNQTAQADGKGRGTRASPQRGGERPGGDGNPAASGGGDPANTSAVNLDRLLSESGQQAPGPLTGDDFTEWSDRLRDVEEMVDQTELRNEVATARARARAMRQEFKRDRKKPDWAVVRLQVMNPLTEVRSRIDDELARRESREALVPIDRDPVPNRYSDLVRRYYEELGKAK